MQILITGIGGFIGSHLAEFFAQKDFNVFGIDNLSRKKILGKKFINEYYNWNYLQSNFKNIKLIKGDITNQDDLRIFYDENIDVIIHTAAQVAVTTSIEQPKLDFLINLEGTLNILELARKKDSTIIFLSTNKVYGENVNKIKIKEGAKRYEIIDEKYKYGIPEDFPIDLTSHTPYGCSKTAADIYVQDYHYTYGLKTFSLRLSCIYGTRQFGVEDQGWVSWFTIATLTGQEINIYGNGKQVRDVLFVTDLCELIEKIIFSQISHRVYNIGGGIQNSISLLELLDFLFFLTNKKAKINFFDWRKGDQYVYISDISLVKKDLNWEPKIDVKSGIKKLVDWVSQNINIFK
jgi:CDP-paratose 2-epimerase